MSRWQYFPEVDERMDDEFMDKLVQLRHHLDFPFTITSHYRDAELNTRVGGGARSAHLIGRAIDIKVSGERAFKLLASAPRFGMTGIGVKQNGDWAGRIIHLDDCDDTPERPRPRIWSY
jgi:uncharacterized protein YcbK (DUF882 family)